MLLVSHAIVTSGILFFLLFCLMNSYAYGQKYLGKISFGSLAVEDSIAKINSAKVKSFYIGMVKVVNSMTLKITRGHQSI